MGFWHRVWNMIRSVWAWLTREFREGWLPFWICYVVTWVAPFLYALLTGVIIGLLNQLAPLPPLSPPASVVTPAAGQSQGIYYLTEDIWELAVWRLLYAF